MKLSFGCINTVLKKIGGKLKEGSLCLIGNLPLVSHLPNIARSRHKEAIVEMVWLIGLATLPVWSSSLIYVFFINEAQKADVGFLGLFYEQVRVHIENGDAIIYCASLLAPIIYVAFGHYEEVDGRYKPFPSSKAHAAVVGIIVVVASLFFLMKKMDARIANKQAVVDFSYALMITTAFLLYVANAYKQGLNAPEKFTQESRDFAERYGERREG